jgi:hypothetical protein
MLVALKHFTTNIGDDIQRLGLMTLLPKDTVFIDREDRHALMALQPSDKLIVNGWFNKAKHHWYKDIKAQCLYIGFYSDKPIKTDAIVGCRDTHTLGLYDKSWLSYCTSMLLAREEKERNGVVLCDVSKDCIIRIPEHFSQNAKVVSHEPIEGWGTNRDAEAKRLLDIYAGAELVITSRLHVLLPCLAYGTPVVFTNRPFEPQRARGYEGLYWTMEDCPWACGAPNKELPWIHISPKVSPEYIRGMTQGLRAVIKKFINEGITK